MLKKVFLASAVSFFGRRHVDRSAQREPRLEEPLLEGR
jgi:hypothetical protein